MKVRWPIGKTIGILLAGTIPLLGIIVEHFQTRDIKARFTLDRLGSARANAGTSKANARPRCDAASFSSGLSCAAVRGRPE